MCVSVRVYVCVFRDVSASKATFACIKKNFKVHSLTHGKVRIYMPDKT
jgi:hypothetical protein